MTYTEDYVQLRNLVESYSTGVTLRDEAMICATFAEDGEWIVAAPFNAHITGAAAIAQSIIEQTAPMEFVVQMVQSVVPQISGDRAELNTIVHEIARMADHSSGPRMWGLYSDLVERKNGAWLFKRRSFQPICLDDRVPVGIAFPLDGVS